jgi:hypothetical protein
MKKNEVYHLKSRPLKRKELNDSLGENKTFFIESSPSKVLNDLVISVDAFKDEYNQKIEKNKY